MKMMLSYGDRPSRLSGINRTGGGPVAKGRGLHFPCGLLAGYGADETVENILRRMAITDRLMEENAQQLRTIGRSEIPEQACLF